MVARRTIYKDLWLKPNKARFPFKGVQDFKKVDGRIIVVAYRDTFELSARSASVVQA